MSVKSKADIRAEKLLPGNQDFTSITNDIAGVPEQKKTPIQWWLLFGFALSLLAIFVGSVGFLIWEGTGIWGINNPVFWGWAIINFVWWVGIGHAGTLISAILHLFRQNWRNALIVTRGLAQLELKLKMKIVKCKMVMSKLHAHLHVLQMLLNLEILTILIVK